MKRFSLDTLGMLRIFALFHSGASYRAIGRAFGVSAGAVARKIKRWGWLR